MLRQTRAITVSRRTRSALLLLTLLVVGGCRETAPPSTPSEATKPTPSERHEQEMVLAGESIDSWVISVCIDKPGTNRSDDVCLVLPPALRNDALQLLCSTIKRCKLVAGYRRIQSDWGIAEDAFVLYRLEGDAVYRPRYDITVFDLDANPPLLEVLEYCKDAPDPKITGEPLVPAVARGYRMPLEGGAARELYSFFLSVIPRKERPTLARWLEQRIANEK
jgi:hypothetical protein